MQKLFEPTSEWKGERVTMSVIMLKGFETETSSDYQHLT